MTANATSPYWTGTVSFQWQTFMKHHDCRTHNLRSKAFDYRKCFVTNLKSLQSLFFCVFFLTTFYYLVSCSQCILLLCWNLPWDIMINQHFKQRRVEKLLTLSNSCEIHVCCLPTLAVFQKKSAPINISIPRATSGEELSASGRPFRWGQLQQILLAGW